LERYEGAAVASRRIAAGPDGRWALPDVLGGQYRIRAWAVPDMMGRRATVLFVGPGQPPIVLTMEQLTDQRVVTGTPSPSNPAVIGQEMGFNVRVVGTAVSADGRLRTAGRPNVPVTLTPSGWDVRTPLAVVTDASGLANYIGTCRAARATLTVKVGEAAPVVVDTGACIEPPSPESTGATPSTTATTATTARPAPGR
jgi:hypothetical protein